MPGQIAIPEISAPTDRLMLAQECVRGRVHGSAGDNIVLTGVCFEGVSVSMGFQSNNPYWCFAEN